MRKVHIQVMTAFAAMTLSSGWAMAQTCPGGCNTCFTEENGQAWDTDGNWTAGVPISTQVACILEGQTAIIVTEDTDADVKALKIFAGAGGRGKVHLEKDRTLTIHSGAVNSVIDGDLTTADNSFIELGADITIDGNGGKMAGFFYHPYPIIRSTDATLRTLTLQGNNNSARSTSMVMSGGWTVQVKVANEGYVVADFEGLELDEGGSGSGTWIAEGSITAIYGHLVIKKAVTGSGDWIIQNHFEAEIIFDAASTALTGDVTITEGVLTINADFKTTGTLDASPTGGAKAKITVAAGKTAEFDTIP